MQTTWHAIDSGSHHKKCLVKIYVLLLQDKIWQLEDNFERWPTMN